MNLGLKKIIRLYPQFGTNHDLFKIFKKDLKISKDLQNLVVFEAEAYHAHKNHEKYAYIDCIFVNEIYEDLEIDWETNKLKIDSSWIKELENYLLGTDKVYESVKEVIICDTILYESCQDIRQDINMLHKHFPNLKSIQMEFIHANQPECLLSVGKL